MFNKADYAVAKAQEIRKANFGKRYLETISAEDVQRIIKAVDNFTVDYEYADAIARMIQILAWFDNHK